MKHFYQTLLLISASTVLLLPSQSCNEDVEATSTANKVEVENKSGATPFVLSDDFRTYWYSGKAEVSSYHLQQARYGEIHDGNAVLIFVTEDFSRSKQVKLDHPENAGADKLPVMKMNMEKKFNTGIYSYSMMLSVFKPIDINNELHAIKETATVQEWCGNAYTQLNLRDKKNEVTVNSYFENEGDQQFSFNTSWLEDELWNLIRIAPDHLPTGDQTILPGFFFTRLSHVPLELQKANLSLIEENGTMKYTMEVAAEQHTLIIHFQKEFPYRILAWEETFPGFDGKLLTTTAVLNKTIISDYWVHHKYDDRSLRELLGLPKDSQ
ncbi:MAG: hypothetical protein LH473_14100 [Chitinophagales bacterium]|nr:hypothetical protein [Chitinophagales bacterium]